MTGPAPHAVFFDPYSPDGVNQEMWTLELVHRAARARLRPERALFADDLHALDGGARHAAAGGFFCRRGRVHGREGRNHRQLTNTARAAGTRPLGRPLAGKKGVRLDERGPVARRVSAADARGPISKADFEMLRRASAISAPRFDSHPPQRQQSLAMSAPSVEPAMPPIASELPPRWVRPLLLVTALGTFLLASIITANRARSPLLLAGTYQRRGFLSSARSYLVGQLSNSPECSSL